MKSFFMLLTNKFFSESLKVDVLSIYYLRRADSLLVGNPNIIQKTLDEDLSQWLQGQKCLLRRLLPLTKRPSFRLVSLKALESGDRKRTAMSPL